MMKTTQWIVPLVLGGLALLGASVRASPRAYATRRAHTHIRARRHVRPLARRTRPPAGAQIDRAMVIAPPRGEHLSGGVIAPPKHTHVPGGNVVPPPATH